MNLPKYSRLLVILATIATSVCALCLIISNASETESSATYHGEFNDPTTRPVVAELKIGDRALDFELPIAKGGTIRLSQVKGQKVVLAFIASFG